MKGAVPRAARGQRRPAKLAGAAPEGRAPRAGKWPPPADCSRHPSRRSSRPIREPAAVSCSEQPRLSHPSAPGPLGTALAAPRGPMEAGDAADAGPAAPAAPVPAPSLSPEEAMARSRARAAAAAAASERAAAAAGAPGASGSGTSAPSSSGGFYMAAISMALSAVAVTYLFGGLGLFGGGIGGFGGGAGDEFEREVLPTPDARATVKFRSSEIGKNIDELFEYVALPNTWPLWQSGCDGVSGEIDTVAEAGNRVRASLHGDAGLGASREVQWTIMQVREPRYSMDGDGLVWAVGKDVRQPSWSLDMRLLLKPLRRGKLTNFTTAFYWTGSHGGQTAASAAMKKQWTEGLKDSMGNLAFQLQPATVLTADSDESE
eukprot:SAG22_NODE_10_length_35702_cov_72.266992_15_plen_375_part_00